MDDIQVLIVDPHQLAREGLRLLLAGEAYAVVCATTSRETALPKIEGGGRPRIPGRWLGPVAMSHSGRCRRSPSTPKRANEIEVHATRDVDCNKWRATAPAPNTNA
jgi:CheY-like chemotaxis protein